MDRLSESIAESAQKRAVGVLLVMMLCIRRQLFLINTRMIPATKHNTLPNTYHNDSLSKTIVFENRFNNYYYCTP